MKKLVTWSISIKKIKRNTSNIFSIKKKHNTFLLIASFLILLSSCQKALNDWSVNVYDGALNWEQITKKAAWGNRLDHEVAVLNDELYLIGGYNPGKVTGDPYYEDVWKSTDGIEWTNLTNEGP